MSIADALSAISQIQQQFAELSTGTLSGTSAASSSASTAGTSAPASTGGLATATGTTDAATSTGSATAFADALAQAQGSGIGSSLPTLETSDLSGLIGTDDNTLGTYAASPSLITGGASTTAGVSLPAAAASQMTAGQQQFAETLAADTGLNPGVVSAWVLSEESGSAAQSRQASGNNDWLNVGYTDSGTYGSADATWSDPISAADATAGWLRGQGTIPGYGTAGTQIQAILQTVGQSPDAQIAALQNSGWASSGYPSLPSLYAQITG